MQFEVIGKSYGLQDAGQYVYKGDFVSLRARGWINTRIGETVNPDGADMNGNMYDAVDDAFGQHPSVKHKKYVLLAGVDEGVYAGGKAALFQSNHTGRLSFGINDNYTDDNNNSWIVDYQCGSYLHQKILIVAQGLPHDDIAIVEAEALKFEKMVQEGSQNKLQISVTVHKTTLPFTAGDFANPFNNGLVASYNDAFFKGVIDEGIDMSEYQLVIRLYFHPAGAGFGNPDDGVAGVSFPHVGADLLWPFISAVRAEKTNLSKEVTTNKVPLVNVLIHEYIHILSYMFADKKTGGFANPDDMGKNSIPYDKDPARPEEEHKVSYYKGILSNMLDYSPPPYARLCFEYGELRQ